jgi:hypothetical protein
MIRLDFLASSPRCYILFPLLLRTAFQSSQFLLIDEFASFSPRVCSEITTFGDFTCAFEWFHVRVESSLACHADCCEPFISACVLFPRADQLTPNELALFRSILADLENPGDGAVLTSSGVARAFNAFVAAWKSRTPSSSASGESSLADLDQLLNTQQLWVHSVLIYIQKCTQLPSSFFSVIISQWLR